MKGNFREVASREQGMEGLIRSLWSYKDIVPDMTRGTMGLTLSLGALGVMAYISRGNPWEN